MFVSTAKCPAILLARQRRIMKQEPRWGKLRVEHKRSPYLRINFSSFQRKSEQTYSAIKDFDPFAHTAHSWLTLFLDYDVL